MKSAPGKSPCAADAGLGDRLLGRGGGEALGQGRGDERVDREEVDRAGDGGAQAVGREARDARGCPSGRR